LHRGGSAAARQLLYPPRRAHPASNPASNKQHSVRAYTTHGPGRLALSGAAACNVRAIHLSSAAARAAGAGAAAAAALAYATRAVAPPLQLRRCRGRRWTVFFGPTRWLCQVLRASKRTAAPPVCVREKREKAYWLNAGGSFLLWALIECKILELCASPQQGAHHDPRRPTLSGTVLNTGSEV